MCATEKGPVHRQCPQSPIISWSYLAITALILAVICGCANARTAGGGLPPILAMEEIGRPYTKLAVVQVSRDRLGAAAEPSTEDFNWGHDALRKEAARIGADAVILPEIRVEGDTYASVPASTILARGVAIRFQ